METTRGIFFEPQNDDEDYPTCEYFDYTEAIASNLYGDKGRKLKLWIDSQEHLEAVIIKSDSATILITELELEEAPGTGRFTTILDLIIEQRDKLQGSAGYFSGPYKAKFDYLLNAMHEMITGRKPFQIVFDDPLSNTFVKKDTSGDMKIEVEEYIRSWEQNREYGLVSYREDNANYSEDREKSVKMLVELIKNSKSIAGFTGAGVSVESGVPAFRQTAEDDMWSNYDPKDSELPFFLNSEESRERHYNLKTNFIERVLKASPNGAHKIVAHLESSGKLHSVVTQNIDDLHHRAGVPLDKIIPLHGSEMSITCFKCKKTFDRMEIHRKLLAKDIKVPTCDECGSFLKSGTILFGEALDPDVTKKATDVMNSCDLLIVMGSSLLVQPANTLPGIPLNRGVPVVIINQSETKYDQFVDMVIYDTCGEFMDLVIQSLN